jgi:hypothetical protein
MAYRVTGLKNGETLYYTGRAGEGWVSRDEGESWEFETRRAASEKRATFNKFTPVHGVHFVVVGSRDQTVRLRRT